MKTCNDSTACPTTCATCRRGVEHSCHIYDSGKPTEKRICSWCYRKKVRIERIARKLLKSKLTPRPKLCENKSK